MRTFIVAAFAIFAAAATAQAEPGLSVPPDAADFNAMGKICPRIFKPVCGIKHHKRHTYGNSCEAKAAGARHIKAGACKKASY